MIQGFVFGIGVGVEPAFIVVGLVLRHGILRIIGNLIKVAAVVAVAAAVVVTPFHPPAVVVPIIALLWWAFVINPRERDSDPVWANVAGFVFCASLLLFVALLGTAAAACGPGAGASGN